MADSVVASPKSEWKTDAWQDDDDDNDKEDVANEATMADMDLNQDTVGSRVHDMDDSESQEGGGVVRDEPMDIGIDPVVVSEDQGKQTASTSESEDVTKPMAAESVVSPSDVETIVKCLTNLLAAVRNAADTVVRIY